MKIRVRRPKECDLLKGLDKTNLVLVEVPVNGEKGQFTAHRWKDPKQGLAKTKNIIQKKSGKKGNVEFKSKKTGKSISDADVINAYMKDKKVEKLTLEDFISKNYNISVEKREDKPKKNSKKINKGGRHFRKVSPKSFAKSIKLAKETVDASVAWRVTSHVAKEYKHTKNYVSKGGSTFAIADDGDIISVCKHRGDTLSGKDILKEAVKQGGVKLDSYGGNHKFYQQCGFEPVSWCRWEDKHAPEDWNENFDREHIIFYKYTGKVPDRIETPNEFFRRMKPSIDYDAAYKVRENSLREK